MIDGYFHGVSCCPPALKRSLLNPDVWKALGGYDSVEVLRHHYDRADTPDPLSRIQYVDMKTYLVDDILVKVDRASMANSLEVRCPILDHKFMELAAQIPSHLKLRNGVGKFIFKKSLERSLPADVLTRKKKGFAVPVDQWFRGELKDYAHAAIIERKDGMLDHRFIEERWNQHQRGQRDWSALLWCVLMFRSWQTVSEAL